MRQYAQKSIFKAYDIRGRYPEDINEATVAQIVSALAKLFSPKAKSRRPKPVVVVGRDARLSSLSLYKVVLKGIKRSYVLKNVRTKIVPAGMITTPMLYFLVNYFDAAGGIMITASHNPKEYNGLKVVSRGAEPISGKDIAALVS